MIYHLPETTYYDTSVDILERHFSRGLIFLELKESSIQPWAEMCLSITALV
jgi:hypothetical protein